MFGQPKALLMLSSTEMWERFSYYGMRAILVLYMVGKLADGGLGWDRAYALNLYGTYGLCVWVAPILGGFLADRYLGQRLAILIGSVIIAIGHLLLAASPIGCFYAGLGCIILGTGFFKPCVTTILGALYEENDSRRDAGYSIFYMGINVGSFFGGIVTGWLQTQYGFHYGFAAAAVGMVVAMAIFLLARKFLGNVGVRPSEKTIKEKVAAVPLSQLEKKRIGFIFVLAFITTLYFVAYEQGGGMLTIFTDQYTDRMVGGWEIPTAWLAASLNPLFIVLLAPVLSSVWGYLMKRNKDLSIINKLALGFALTAIAFFLLIGPTRIAEAHPGTKVSLVWVVVFYALYTAAELLVIPIVWSMVSRVAPQKYLSALMAVVLASVGIGYKLAGYVGGYIDQTGPAQIFVWLSVVMFVFGGVCIFLNKGLMKWISMSEEELAAPVKVT